MALIATSAGWRTDEETGAKRFVVELVAETESDVPRLSAATVWQREPLRLLSALEPTPALADGYRVLGPGEMDGETLERAVNVVLTSSLQLAGIINADRSVREAHAANIRALAKATA